MHCIFSVLISLTLIVNQCYYVIILRYLNCFILRCFDIFITVFGMWLRVIYNLSIVSYSLTECYKKYARTLRLLLLLTLLECAAFHKTLCGAYIKEL